MLNFPLSRLLAFFALFAFFSVGAFHASEVSAATVAQNSTSNWTILVAKAPVESTPFNIDKANGWNANQIGYEKAAASELAQTLERISGAKFSVVEISEKSETEKYSRLIAVGNIAKELGAVPPKSRFGADGSTVVVQPNRILLAGETPIASYFAMTRLLEMAGCRWYMPGTRGEIIPRRSTLCFPVGKFDEVPQVWSRLLWYSGGAQALADGPREEFHRWMLHNRQYGVYVDGGHIWYAIMPPGKYFQEHPEWYAQVGGKRKPVMLCTSNEAMTKQFIQNYAERIRKLPNNIWFSLSQDDGVEFCECANCTALDPGLPDPIMRNHPQITDRLVNFYNIVVIELHKEFPDKYFCFLAYGNSTMPPTREKLHPHLMPLIAPITYSRYHALNATNSETMQALRGYIEDWGKVSQDIGYRGYAFNLADVILPYTREEQTRVDIPMMARHGLGDVSMETMGGWGNMLPWYYLLARLNLNPQQNADAILDEFYVNFFGPAAADMKAYNGVLREAYANIDYEIGNQWFAPLVFTPQRVRQLQTHLNAAERKTRNDRVLQERLALWRYPLRSLELFLQMRRQTNAFDFAAASKTAVQFYDLGMNTATEDPHAATPYTYKYWWKRFWKDQIDLSAQKLQGSQVAYEFPDEWRAFVDHSGIGFVGKLYDPSTPLTRWRPLKTYSQTIGEQGLTRFRGTIWYRHDFNLDAKYSGKPLHLLFSGIDNRITLFVNGQKVGETKSGGAFDAFDFDVTKHLHPGKNTIVAAVNNEGITELETGGIMRPVVLYQPAP